MKYQMVKFRDIDTNLIWTMAGALYKENDNFLVICSGWTEEEVSWSSSFTFKVIPKELIVKVYPLKNRS